MSASGPEPGPAGSGYNRDNRSNRAEVQDCETGIPDKRRGTWASVNRPPVARPQGNHPAAPPGPGVIHQDR